MFHTLVYDARTMHRSRTLKKKTNKRYTKNKTKKNKYDDKKPCSFIVCKQTTKRLVSRERNRKQVNLIVM